MLGENGRNNDATSTYVTLFTLLSCTVSLTGKSWGREGGGGGRKLNGTTERKERKEERRRNEIKRYNKSTSGVLRFSFAKRY